MNISVDTWAVVLATFLGPVLAVALTLAFTYWRETSGDQYRRRLDVFRTLMSTRRVAISIEHVNALNLVEVDFYGCSAVEAEWKAYKHHLGAAAGVNEEEWFRKKEKLLAKLLFQIATVLKFNMPAIEIFEGGYAPQAWAERDRYQMGALQYINELRQGSNELPLWVRGITPTPSSEPPRGTVPPPAAE